MSKIDDRLITLKIELATLQQTHQQMVEVKQKQDEEFRQRVADNQARFQQLNGAIQELEAIQKDGVTEDKKHGKRN